VLISYDVRHHFFSLFFGVSTILVAVIFPPYLPARYKNKISFHKNENRAKKIEKKGLVKK